MIKNFLASAERLRKETHTFTLDVHEGDVISYTDADSNTRYGVVYNDVELNGKETKVGSIITAGFIIQDNVNFGNLASATVIENAKAQGLFFEVAKVTVVPADVAQPSEDSSSSR